ncbi:hypothetical protein [Roseovarius aestuarii]|uniref:Alpha/beta hydrolase family protein n=1 Tax=Roseovarius aestuarii TaxID=475083 RepID=A0A1X7BPP9_9RHOB|nr:hypothetical protein [Roseovarius aestuarii]SMC11504.1 hypothetical protein ROA7745_01317 [Roseovarius aestuarii]
MAQRIIMIHGRSTKPAKQRLAMFQRQALLQGLERVNPAKAKKVADGAVEIDFVYYGDISNRILAVKSDTHAKRLTETDPHSDNAPCLPDVGFADAIDALGAIRRFDKRAYRKILKENDDLRFMDDAARAVSTIAAITTATFLNTVGIKLATADMGAYLMRRSVGSKVRERLQTPLRRALKRGDDICLISHSMGCIVAYDVLWKFSRMSEYADVRENGNRISQWLTLGCPLGEAGVKANLYDGHERAHDDGTDKHPKNIVKHWHNTAAVDDFISHDTTMKDDYKAMTKFDYVDSITDKRIYNCYAMGGKANPHKFYGYLAHPIVANDVASWIK